MLGDLGADDAHDAASNGLADRGSEPVIDRRIEFRRAAISRAHMLRHALQQRSFARVQNAVVLRQGIGKGVQQIRYVRGHDAWPLKSSCGTIPGIFGGTI